MTLGELRKELDVYNKTINNYNKTFNLNLNIHTYVKNPQKYAIKDYQEINDKLVEFLKSHREKLIEYENDYYKSKTITEISIKLRIDITTIVEYLQKRLNTYLIISKKENPKNEKILIDKIDGDAHYVCPENEGLIYEKTKVCKMSSYDILKKIQIEILKSRIEFNMKEK
ncbi:hypothetical protein LPB136_08585 [Tenacibaculum todarodis]|uniref:Uncharacterized protein n=1 Tax=Tenacibaculum todarodis TaxID=1850252 RepID=A0A1L3JJU3_9FLAO|nr:hypothetical protein [Tenacibaculum todarodis]APG65406.1 hypothetical protein LPB136_08585 [Tenacibaculum todarodis]